MATKIIPKKSSVAAKVPLATDLDVGEIAINLADQKLYSKTAAGAVVEIGGGSGATYDQDLNTTDDVIFNSVQLSGGTGTQGTLTWNVDEETLDLDANGTTLQIGQELVWNVKNQTGAAIPNGTPVMATGTVGTSGRITVAPMVGSNPANAKYFLGVTTEAIANGADGKVTHFGKVRDIDTSGYTEGTVLYISTTTAGAFQTTEPTAPNLNLPVAFVITSHANNGVLAVRVKNIDVNAFQPYNEDTVIDGSYVHTDNNYTTTEKNKLAGIEAGATADQTPAEILTAIKTVDGSGSGLDADLLDGYHASSFLLTSGKAADSNLLDGIDSSQFLRSDASDQYYRISQTPHGNPINNLGDPSVTEMALFQEQFDNKTAFYDINYLKFYTSTDGTNWTEYTAFSDDNKRKFVGGDYSSGINIPYNTPYFRIEVANAGPYVYLNALYMYWSGSGNTTTVKIRKQRGDGVWSQHTNSSAGVGSWPGHLYLPFSTIPFNPSTTSTGHYRTVHIDFQPTWSTTLTNPISLYRMQLWGGYPAGKRTHFTVDQNKQTIFPSEVYANGSTSNKVFHDGYHPNADKLTTARNIALTGDVTGSASFDGSANISITATVADDSHNHVISNVDGLQTALDSKLNLSGGTITGTLTATNIVATSNGTGTAYKVGDDAYIGDINVANTMNVRGAQNSDRGYISFGNNSTQLGRIGTGSLTWGGSTIWHAGNDGVGSGLDADTVDGVHESTFMRKTANSNLNMTNYNITNVNHITFNDPGPNEGIEWLSGNGWKIYESPDNLTTNSGGNLQFVTGSTRLMTLGTNGSLWTGSQGTLWGTSNDGAGSGLDADTLDGVQGSSYLRSDASDTFTSLSGTSLTLGSGTTLQESTDRPDLLQITSNTSSWGGLQIRNSSSDGRWSFMTDGSAAGIFDDENGDWHIYMTENAGVSLRYNNSTKLSTTSSGVSVTGTVTATDFNTTSDARLKENVSTIDKALDKVLAMRGVEFDWKETGEHTVGFIAQEVEEVVPELVSTNEEDGIKSVKYGNVTALLLEAIKELQSEVAALKAQVNKQ